MHCGPFERPRHNRREMLSRSAQGFGGIALASLLSDPSFVGPASAAIVSDPDGTMAPQRTHFPARARNVIFLYMDGGVSQVDSFDPKPQLAKENGQRFKMKVQPSQFDNPGNVLQSPWKFRQYGESGIPISDLFPHVAQCADDLCVIRSMTSAFPEHTNANYFLHTGHGLQGRPCMGAWTAYGLGTESHNLPGFVVLNGGLIPPGGVDCFHNGFLPATFQGSIFKPGATPVADLAPPGESPVERARKIALLRTLEGGIADRMGQHDAVESAIANYELAFRMQTAVPELMDIDSESKSVQEAYGLFDKFEHTRTYGHQCLVARRLVERGVRFIELTCPRVKADRWDQHRDLLDGHTLNAKAVDQPIAALLKDLKSRFLFNDTATIEIYTLSLHAPLPI